MFCIMYTTIDDMNEALSISETLVEEKLVACTNIVPITSVFNWDGMQNDEEFGIIMKTMEDLVEMAAERLKELHPYELPCVIWLPINGSHEYLEWIHESLE